MHTCNIHVNITQFFLWNWNSNFCISESEIYRYGNKRERLKSWPKFTHTWMVPKGNEVRKYSNSNHVSINLKIISIENASIIFGLLERSERYSHLNFLILKLNVNYYHVSFLTNLCVVCEWKKHEFVSRFE